MTRLSRPDYNPTQMIASKPKPFSQGRFFLFILPALLLSTACSSKVNWRNHFNFRTQGKQNTLSYIDPTEAITGVIQRQLHYASLALDSVYFRDLPAASGNWVAFGCEVSGILSDNKTIKIILDIQESRDGSVLFNNLQVMEPFLYGGRNITVTFHFWTIPAASLESLRGRLQSARQSVGRLDPLNAHSVEIARELFQVFSGTLHQKEGHWSYRMTLYPVDGNMRDKPDLLFTAARHIMIAVPPADAPSRYHEFRPHRIYKKLMLQGSRLVVKATGSPYVGTPYIIMNIVRYRRYPRPDTKVKAIEKKIDNLIENGEFEFARGFLYPLGQAIINDPIITQEEKNLAKMWKEFRAARIKAGIALRKKESARELAQMIAQFGLLSQIRTHFQKCLEPAETKDVNFRLMRLERRINQRLIAGGLSQPPGYKAILATLKDAKKKQLHDLERQRFRMKRARGRKIDWVKVERYYIGDKTPVYKKWWFWTIIGAVVVGGALSAYLAYEKLVPEPGVSLPLK